jgi:methyltransferase (TIGR00027 family)
MSSASPIRHISDTALWVAVYRAEESERADAVFRDRYARKLAGNRGMQIAAALQFARRHSWSYVARTWLIDQVIEHEVQQGADMVVNLAAGLDSRPYRMQLPASLRWVEVDLPDMLNYKQEVLASERPVCAVERVPLDLRDVTARRALFQRLGGEAKRVLVVSEGLIVYLEADGVAELARDLSTPSSFRLWVTDLTSPALLKMLQKAIGGPLVAAGSPLKFAPREGARNFSQVMAGR